MLASEVHRLSYDWPKFSETSRKNKNMLSRCANSQCSKPFLKLRDGKLFLVETERVTKPGEPAAPPFVRARQQQRCVEHYWLCDDCAAQWTLLYDREHGVRLSPLRKSAASVAAAATAGARSLA